MILKPYLQLMVEKQASDLYVSANALPQLRVEGKVLAVGRKPIDPQHVERGVAEMMSERERSAFERRWELDFSYALEGVGRFRVNAFRQRGSVAMVIRYVHPAAPRIRDLGLP